MNVVKLFHQSQGQIKDISKLPFQMLTIPRSNFSVDFTSVTFVVILYFDVFNTCLHITISRQMARFD